MIAKIGENLILSELIVFPNNDNHTFYVHNSYRNNIGKIISLILYSSDEINEEIKNSFKKFMYAYCSNET